MNALRMACSMARTALLVSLATAAAAEEEPPLSVQQQLDALARENREMRQQVEELRSQVDAARQQALAAQDVARAERAAAPRPDRAAAASGSAVPGLQLLDLSLDVLTSAGGSTADDHELETLQGGEHDPRQRGFTLQQVELGFRGAVDPFFTGEAYLVYFLDSEGESRFELEEAFATTRRLPFGLEDEGLQLELGQFFTDFGRQNPQHPHTWEWQDQPVVLSRFFGGDGMRQTGAQLRWLTPLPWYSELMVTAQNAKGETMVSFLANEEVFEERPIGGRPFDDPSVANPGDLVFTTRWANGFDLSDSWSAQLGASWATGPNAADRRTNLWGGDFVAKWVPLQTDRGWPFATLEGEFLFRRYRAGSDTALGVSGATLNDWGFYTQAVWGFRRPWSVGLRLEHATASGKSLDPEDNFTPISHNEDPYRSTRWRVSPLLTYRASEYARLRLQYNYDHADDLDDASVHTIWAGFEFSFGAHPAHGY